jgi:hypothetical protein
MSAASQDSGAFTLNGFITHWDSVTRVLHIGEHTLWVMPGVSILDVATGVKITAIGHRDAHNRRMVTELTIP